jgi:hypothetical protein
MVDILQAIIAFLNINCSVVTCYYANPLEGLFYLFFFPTVFLILLVYIISNAALQGEGLPQGLRLLIGIAVYIFIILQGWFTFAVTLSRLWFILLPILGIIWFVMRHFRGERRGGFPAISRGPLEYFKERAKAGGGRTGLEKMIENRIKTLEGILKEIKNPKPGSDVGILMARYWEVKTEAENAIKELERMVGWPTSKVVASKYWQKISDLTEKFEKEERKAEKEERKAA